MALAVALCAQQAKIVRMPSPPESKIIRKIQPAYPADAADLRIQGVVKLSVTIGTDGRIEHMKVLSGHPLLTPAAMQAVRRWVFEPFGTDDQPVRVITEIDVPFLLDGLGRPSAPKL